MKTSKLGSINSRLGNIKLGIGSDTNNFDAIFSDSLSFTDVMSGHDLHQLFSSSLSFTDLMLAFKVSGESTDTITFTDVASKVAIFARPLTDSVTFSDISYSTKLGSMSDTVVFSDTMSEILRINVPAITETLTLTEALLRNIVSSHSIPEQLLLVDSLTRHVYLLKQFADTLIFSDNCTAIAGKLMTSTLTFTDLLDVFLSKNLREALDFEDIIALNTVIHRLTADVMPLFDAITVQLYLRLTLIETLVFTDSMIGLNIKTISDTLPFTETWLETNSKRTADTLSLIDLVIYNQVKHVPSADIMTFAEQIAPSLIVTKLINDIVIFADQMRARRWVFATMTDSITFSDLMFRERREATSPDTLTFTETRTVHKIATRIIPDSIILHESLSVNTVLRRTLSETVKFADRCYGMIEGKNVILIGLTRSIVLPPPEFNDFENDQAQLVVKRTMTGVVSTFIKTTDKVKIHYEFIIPKPKADELRAFLDVENPNQITLYDFKGLIWSVKLLTDSVDKEEVGRWEPCGNKTRVTVEFIGTRYA